MADDSREASRAEEERRSLPGWSLAREGPRQKPKQGWECPVPTVQDWEDYKKWKEDQDRKDELPAAPQVFLADTSLLFHRDGDVQLPWIHRLKCELPRRVGRLSGELPVKSSFIGFGLQDASAAYEIFKEAMAQIGIVFCRQIHHPPSRFEIAHLEQSDLVLVGGGDRKRLWETLGTDMGGNEVAEHVKWRYLQGALVIAVGEAVSLLGEQSWYTVDHGGSDRHVVPFSGWKIFPHIVALEDEDDVDLEDMVETLGGPKVVILGLSSGGGLIFNKDGLVEPVRHMVQEYRWDWRSEGVKRALLVGPPRGTGLVCPLYAAMQEREEDEAEAVDVYSYALTEEEEQEEDRLVEVFDPKNTAWVTPQVRDELESLKDSGNNALKAGKPDLALLSYNQAIVLLRSNAQTWSQLGPKTRQELEDTGKVKSKDEFRATVLELPLLLNICAARLLSHENELKKQSAVDSNPSLDKKQDDEKELEDACDHASRTGNAAANAGEPQLALVEITDNLGQAFSAANDALRATAGCSAKAWYRRGCAFEAMHDPTNALRDFEEALRRSPGDKAIKNKRVKAAAASDKVAEDIYYARHKELDKEVEKLHLRARRSLAMRGVFGDSYKVTDQQGYYKFAAAQTLAWVYDVCIEEVDGRLQIVVDGPDDVAASLADHILTKSSVAYFHPHAKWTWEFMVQWAAELQFLRIEDVDLGSGALEYICADLRTHKKVQALQLIGAHVGPSGAKMLRNVLAQNTSLVEVAFDSCALQDAGVDEVAAGLDEHEGAMERLSLRDNLITHKSLARLAKVMGREEKALDLSELDLSGNSIALAGAKEVGKIIASGAHRLRVLRLQDSMIESSAFWRLVNNLSDTRPLATLDLQCNPVGRGTRRVWRCTIGPTTRCEVLLSGDPRQGRKERDKAIGILRDRGDPRGYPLPRFWV